jgi:hypothetical protein
MAKEAYAYGKRALCIWQKSPMHMAKEAYFQRHTAVYIAKEAYAYGKRGLCIWQKRPMHMAKEAYAYGKRGGFSEA